MCTFILFCLILPISPYGNKFTGNGFYDLYHAIYNRQESVIKKEARLGVWY